MLRKSPGFSTVAVLSLALGIGANTAIFSMLDAILWKQLPVAGPAHLVNIQTIESGSGRVRCIPPSLLRDLQLDSQVFSVRLAPIPDGRALTPGGRPPRVTAAL